MINPKPKDKKETMVTFTINDDPLTAIIEDALEILTTWTLLQARGFSKRIVRNAIKLQQLARPDAVLPWEKDGWKEQK